MMPVTSESTTSFVVWAIITPSASDTIECLLKNSKNPFIGPGFFGILPVESVSVVSSGIVRFMFGLMMLCCTAILDYFHEKFITNSGLF